MCHGFRDCKPLPLHVEAGQVAAELFSTDDVPLIPRHIPSEANVRVAPANTRRRVRLNDWLIAIVIEQIISWRMNGWYNCWLDFRLRLGSG